MNLELFIDFETRSACELKVCGVDVYAKCPSTEVLCMAYCFGDEEVNLWVPNETLPERVAKHLREGGTVVGHNVGNFEWNIWEFVCTIKYGWPKLSIAQCFDTMAMANAMGLPGSLDMAAQGAGLTHKKDQEGRRIMLQLSQPRDTAGKIFWQKEQVPEKFQKLYDYCKQDVVVERALFRRLTPLSEKERAIWLLDHKINSRGVGIDLETVKRCAVTVANEQERLQKQLEVLTARQVPSFNSHAKFKKWVQSQGLEDVESIDKDSVMTLLNRTDIPPQVREALLIRQEAAKSSTAKLTAMLFGCTEGRARSTFEYYGAKQTGRWARSEERRVGKECCGTCRSRWSPYH